MTRMNLLRGLGKAVLGLLMVALAFAVVVGVVRAVNTNRFPVMESTDLVGAEGEIKGVSSSVSPIAGDYLNGFHVVPDHRKYAGVVVTYGGSEGSAALNRAVELADAGYEVLSLYFFGQDNQRPALAGVPLEQFDEVESYIDAHIADPRPVTVIGSSKGAEFALLLAEHGYPVDNVVAFAPAHYTYNGLDPSGGMNGGSFTDRGEELPYASFRTLPARTGLKMMWEGMTAYPTSYRSVYEQLAAAAGDDARIDVSSFGGNVLAFAGEDDQMWPSDVAARALAEQNPRVEAHVYPGAGHVFFPDAEAVGNGWQLMLGGTVEGNHAADTDSQRLLTARLAQWHPGL